MSKPSTTPLRLLVEAQNYLQKVTVSNMYTYMPYPNVYRELNFEQPLVSASETIL